MPVDYDGLYEDVFRQQWRELSQQQRDDAQSSNRRGQLEPGAPDAHAVHDVFFYLRGHAEVFRAVYRGAGHVPPRKRERLMVVDVGAGAATVAVALTDAVGKGTRGRIDYLAYDPHPMMRRIGECVLGHLDAQFRSARYISSLDGIDFSGVDRLLFAFSYVSHQSAVTDADVDLWASLIGGAVRASSRAVELIYTTASLSGGRLSELGERLDCAGISRGVTPVSVQVKKRFPMPGPDDVGWTASGGNWKVRSEHWVMRA